MTPVVQAATLGLAASTLQYGNLSSVAAAYSDTNVFSQSTASVNSYAQTIIQNTNAGATASADIVVSNNLSTSTTYYGNLGINSSGYTGSGSFNKANAVYLTSTSGDLVIGTTTANAIRFVYNGATTDAVVIDSTGMNFSNADNSVQDFRLTLTSGTPVTIADVVGATTIYCTPYKGNRIALYNGTSWVVRVANEFNIALGILTNGNCYDVFCYDNAGAPTLELLAWTNSTTRATALARQDGVLVKSGTPTRRYIGTFVTTATTTTEDSIANRFLWNYYNRAARSMLATDATNSWTYTLNALRQANANSANQLNFVIGVVEDTVSAFLNSVTSNSTAGVVSIGAIGLNSTTAALANATDYQTFPAGYPSTHFIQAITLPVIGKNYLAWLESSSPTGTATWYGQGQYGIKGSVLA